MSERAPARIVVGVDCSEDAAQALTWAAREAQLREASLTAVMAWGYPEQYRGLARFEVHEDEVEARHALEGFVASTLGSEAAAVHLHVVDDFAPGALLGAAGDASLLVVGARGSGGFLGLRLGSVSDQCLHHAPCPVAIVRANAGDGDPGDLGDLGTGRERIVVGVDGSDASLAAYSWAIEEARLRKASVEVVHAWALPPPVGHPFAYETYDAAMFERAARNVVDTVVDIGDGEGERDTEAVPVERIVAHGSPAASILDIARGADLVVLGSRGLGGFRSLVLGSVAQQVARHAPCPVVVLRGQRAPEGDEP